MKRFLQKQVLKVSQLPRQRVALILGTEAADADSIISALCLAYLKDAAQGRADSDSATPPSIYIPLAVVDRSKLHLRRDVQLLLQRAGLDLEDLICISDIDLQHFKENHDLKLILVDQNTVPSCAISCAELVEEIVDHHLDAGNLVWITGPLRNIAYDASNARALVGSACTLVAESYLSSGFMTEDVAVLLLGVIALDTFDMDPVIDKGTPRDEQAMAALQSVAPATNKKDLFELLRDAKLDIEFWRSLSAEEAISLDYKMFVSTNGCRNGISSVLLPVNEFMTKTSAEEGILKIFIEDDLDLFVAMVLTMLPEGTKRELLCVTKSEESALLLCSHLTGECCSPAGLTLRSPPIAFPSGYTSAVFDQSNVAYSRKQLAKYFTQFDKHCC